METERRQKLSDFLLKCQDVLSQFKKKRRDNFVRYGETQSDDNISKLLSLTLRVEDELRGVDAVEENQIIHTLYSEYEALDNSCGLQDDLINSLRREFENIDKEIWYEKNFDNWVKLPERQECQSYPLAQRLRYSKCRQAMFDHLEREWKKRTYPTLHDRLEFF